MADLNALIPPNSAFYLYAASFIDDEGEIAAFGSLQNGDTHALLLIPCDEHHPGIEGCDYHLMEAPATTRVSPAPVTQSPTTVSPGFRDAANPMLRRFGHPLQLGGKPASSFVLPEDRLWPGEREAGKETSTPQAYGFGKCEVDKKTRLLTGYCAGEKNRQCKREHANEYTCPKGDRAGDPRTFVCGFFVDWTRTCPIL